MRGFVVWLGCLSLALAACAGSAYPSGVPAITGGSSSQVQVTPASTPTAAASGAPSPSTSPTFCPGRTWPPYPLGGIPGVTVVSTERATIEITNRTGRTLSYRVSGWQPDQFETCLALGEVEVQRGPIAAGAIERVVVDPGWQQAGVPVTVALWDKPCGEACAREPVAAMVVELAPLEPAAS